MFSLDTELAWGELWDQHPRRRPSRSGTVERKTIRRLLDIMDEFGVAATWAVTGHLFYRECEECAVCPIMDLKEKDKRFEEIWRTHNDMWYGADLVEMLLSSSPRHEICFHGYTHRLFSKLGEEEARLEINEWLRLAKRKNIVPQTAIFPQGGIGHLDLFRDAGFICYRGKDVRHPSLLWPLLGKVINRLNLGLAILTPQVYDPQVTSNGLVNIPSSLWLFRTNRKVETVLDVLNMHTLRLHPAIQGLKRAAEEKKTIHFWAHPQEFRTEKDFEKLRFIFRHFAEQADAGRLQSITMMELARRTLLATVSRPVEQAYV